MAARVSFVDSCSPMINLFLPNRIVARALCSSLNQCWLILVGTHEINGQAIPVRAWPTKAKLNMESDERPSLKWGRVLRQQRRPPGMIKMWIIMMRQMEFIQWTNPLLKKSRDWIFPPMHIAVKLEVEKIKLPMTGWPCHNLGMGYS